MAATSNESVKIPSGNVTFETAAGIKFDVPVISFARELRELADSKAAGGGDHFAFLADVIEIVRERFKGSDGNPVVLTPDEADWFKDQLEIEHAKKKHKQLDHLRGALNLAYSMASPASPAAESPS